jgi:hypothetical protein
MSQTARNLTDAEQGILTGKRYLIHDRDPLLTSEFLKMIADAGVESVKLPPRSAKRRRAGFTLAALRIIPLDLHH